MKMSEIYSYIYDFLSILHENSSFNKHVKGIILFGSVARGDFTKKSDIDLFFNIKNKEDQQKLENLISDSLRSFEVKAEKTWRLKNIYFPIKFIVGDLNSDEWKSLREDIVSNGMMLFGKFEALPDNLDHYALFHFSLRNISRKEIMRFLRYMFGYKNIKGKKEYSHQGLIEKVGGKKLGPNIVLVPLEESYNLKKVFRRFNIKSEITEVWIKKA